MSERKEINPDWVNAPYDGFIIEIKDGVLVGRKIPPRPLPKLGVLYNYKGEVVSEIRINHKGETEWTNLR